MKEDKLAATSRVYHEKSDWYERFSRAEDFPRRIVGYLGSKLENKVVLDFACGTGKFIPDFSAISKKYIAVDINDSQLKIAREKLTSLPHVEVLLIEKDTLPITDKTIDVVFSSWAIGSIRELALRTRILEELVRVLKPCGTIYLVENDRGGDFKNIIEGEEGNRKTDEKLYWLESHGFFPLKRIETFFEFQNIEVAKEVFAAIWDEEIAEKIKEKRISHNIVILEYSPNTVLDTTRYVVENAEHVKIDPNKLDSFSQSFNVPEESSWLKDSPFDIQQLDDEKKTMLALVFNALSFSYWGDPYWNVEYKGVWYTRGSWSLMAAIFRSVEEGTNLLDPEVISKITTAELAHVLRGNTEIPLIEERKKILNRVGGVLLEKFLGRFLNFVEKSGGDASILLTMVLEEFQPFFDDANEYKGKKIYFHKRAQALVESIHSLFDGQGYGALKNTESLTALADYVIPNLLRDLGILKYSPELMGRIDNEEIIEKGSVYEVEIRASVIWAVEGIKRSLLERGVLVSAKAINDYLWTRGGDIKTPFHRVRTTAY